jgi:hypothetical protein
MHPEEAWRWSVCVANGEGYLPKVKKMAEKKPGVVSVRQAAGKCYVPKICTKELGRSPEAVSVRQAKRERHVPRSPGKGLGKTLR